MSAWMCPPEHLSIVVDGIHLFDLDPGASKASTYATLHLENERSLRTRYGDPISDTHEGYEKLKTEVHPADIYMLARSYRYQSCEHMGWPDSRASHMIEALLLKIGEAWGLDEEAARTYAGEMDGAWSTPIDERSSRV